MRIEQVSSNEQVRQLVLPVADSINNPETMRESKAYFSQHPYYPLLKKDLYNAYLTELKSFANRLMIADKMGDTVRSLLFHDELEKSPELFVRYLTEDAVDKAFSRYVGQPENKKIESLLAPCKDASFRNFYHQIVYLRSDFLFKHMKASGYHTSIYDDGVIAYGYIDTEAGLSFKAICMANLAGNRVNCSPLSTITSMTFRADTIEQASFINLLDTNCDISDFIQTIEYALNYEADENVTLMRRYTFLDYSRHSQFPDDVRVILFKPNVCRECVWVRCRFFNKEIGLLYGELLEEPDNDFSVHLHDLIGFRIDTDNDGNEVCLHLDEFNNIPKA